MLLGPNLVSVDRLGIRLRHREEKEEEEEEEEEKDGKVNVCERN